MTRPHDPEADGSRDEWVVRGLSELLPEEYAWLLAHLGELGLIVTVQRRDVRVTQEGLVEFAIDRGMSPHAAGRAWAALHREGVLEAAGIQPVIAGKRVVGLSGRSLSDAIATRALSRISGFNSRDRVGLGLLQEFTRAYLAPEDLA